MISYKNWPNWLKGGIILGIFSLIIDSAYLITAYGFGDSGFDTLLFVNLVNPKNNIILSNIFFPWVMSSFNISPITFWPTMIYSVAVCFIIGSIIGWVIGKFKKIKN